MLTEPGKVVKAALSRKLSTTRIPESRSALNQLISDFEFVKQFGDYTNGEQSRRESMAIEHGLLLLGRCPGYDEFHAGKQATTPACKSCDGYQASCKLYQAFIEVQRKEEVTAAR